MDRIDCPALLLGLTSLAMTVFLTGCAAVEADEAVGSGRARNPHPLDPLTAAEMEQTRDVLQASGQLQDGTRIGMMELHEPSKEQVKADLAGSRVRRAAYVVTYDWTTRTAAEAVVDLNASELRSWSELDTRDPPIIFLTLMRTREIIFADPRWAEFKRRFHISNDRTIGVGPDLPAGSLLPEGEGDIIVAAFAWRNDQLNMSRAFLPLEMSVNLTRGRLETFEVRGDVDHSDGANTETRPPAPPALKAFSIVQADGPSFTLSGSRITWQNWTVNFGVSPRRGLELYDMAYHDNGRPRSVLYRASIAEMVTPYGDPGWQTWYPSDEGDVSLSNYSLRPAVEGEDTPPNALFRSAWIHDHLGRPIEVPRAVALYERDGGVLWRHFGESRRSRELVLASFFTVDNYDYQLSWILHMDGTIEAEVLLTGIPGFYAVDRQRDSGLHVGQPRSHTLVAPGIAAPIHQHFFSYRLDLDVDGQTNSVVETNTETLPATNDRPSDEWFGSKSVVLRRELEARRNVNVASSRWWHVINPQQTNSLGQPTGYGLMPGANAYALPGPHSAVRKQMKWIESHLWVSRYAPEELYPAGTFLNPDLLGGGLPKWTAADRGIENRDVVLWYTLGITHVPRPEDWPTMPSHRAGFRLVPFGFLVGNPTMDVGPHPWTAAGQ